MWRTTSPRQMRFRARSAWIGLWMALLPVAATAADSTFKLTYSKPAAKWTEALPLGNGRISAMVFGSTQDERLQINESTLWGGGPHDYTNPDAYSHLDEVRKLIRSEEHTSELQSHS